MRKDVRLVESTCGSVRCSGLNPAPTPRHVLPNVSLSIRWTSRLLGSLVVALIKLKLGFSSMLKLEAVWWVCPTVVVL